MSMKSFDKFCEKVINGEYDGRPTKEIFDERQNILRMKLTKRALWLFVIMSGINLIVMECGPQWCESRVMSTAIFGAAAHLYWTAAAVKKDALFGLSGVEPITRQMMFIFIYCLGMPLYTFTHKENADVREHFFFRNGMVSEYFAEAAALLLMVISGIIMAVNVVKFTRNAVCDKENTKNDDKDGD